MKKTLIAALMLTGMLSAHADVAISEATYGIINIPIIEGMNAIGISLLPMPGVDNAVENIVLPEGLTGAEADGEGVDQLYVWDGEQYAIYWLNNSGATPVWYLNGDPSPTANLGNAMWIQAANAGTIYQIGTVSSAAAIDVPATQGNNFIANPYPADINLNADIDWSTIAANGKKLQRYADLIRVWNGSGYDTFYYVGEEGNPLSGWVSANKGQSVTDIPAGEGFWFVRRDEGSTPVTISNPFAVVPQE